MNPMNRRDVEKWLYKHPKFSEDYVVDKMNVIVVNEWLTKNGFSTIDEQGDGTTVDCDSTNDLLIYENKITNSNVSVSAAKNLDRQLVTSRLNEDKKKSADERKKYLSLTFDTVNVKPGSEFQLVAHSLSKLELSGKLLEFQVEGDYKFLLTIIQDLATVSSIEDLAQHAMDNLSIILEADSASIRLLRDLTGDKAFISKKLAGSQLMSSKVVNERNALTSLLIRNCVSSDKEKSWNFKIWKHVASTGDTVNLQIPFEDSRFDETVDGAPKYHTDSLLCLPVMNVSGEIIAVVQVVNKNDGQSGSFFTKIDENVCKTYLEFVGIFLFNILSMDTMLLESGGKCLGN